MIGGTDDTADPGVVAVVNDFLGAYCTGSLVAPRVVLTAGHCLEAVANAVVIGSDATKGVRVGVVARVKHPQYTGEGKDFDFAVLVLERDVTEAAPLPRSHTALDASFVGRPVRHVGFGVTSEIGSAGEGTKRTVTYSVTQVDATKIYSGKSTQNTCTGDSGGPALAVVDAEGTDERIVGVVSDGPDCHSTGWDDRVDVQGVASWLDPIVADDGAALAAAAAAADAGASGGDAGSASTPAGSSGGCSVARAPFVSAPPSSLGSLGPLVGLASLLALSFALSFVLSFALVACGGAAASAPPAQSPSPENAQPGAAPSASAAPPEATPPGEGTQPSVVRFDDLAMTFAVPPGWHVIGDDELARSIHTADPARLSREFKRRVALHGAFPLLSLSHGDTEAERVLVTLSVVPVARGDDPVALLDAQKQQLARSLDGFTATRGPSALARNGVPGAEMTTRYSLKRADGATVRAQGWLRLFTRGELGVVESVSWVERGEDAPPPEATTMMDGVQFLARPDSRE